VSAALDVEEKVAAVGSDARVRLGPPAARDRQSLVRHITTRPCLLGLAAATPPQPGRVEIDNRETLGMSVLKTLAEATPWPVGRAWRGAEIAEPPKDLLSREMSRRDCLKLSGLVVGGLALGSGTALPTPPVARAAAESRSRGLGTDYWKPWVTKLTRRSATINWRGADTGAGSIQYARRSFFRRHHRFTDRVDSRVIAAYQHVRLGGLEPDTEYVYKAKPSDNADVFGIRRFRTMPLSGPFTFLVVCDSQQGSKYGTTERFQCVAAAIAQEKDVLFILHGGDCARFDDEAKWATFFGLADGLLAKFPIFPTIGNHEYHDINGGGQPTAAVQYHQAFDVPLDYSFDCAGVRFVCLNTPDPDNSKAGDPQTSLVLAQSQAAWLQEQLRHTMSGAFTFHHHPIWNYDQAAMNPDLQPWEALYRSGRISASFSGHVHNYERIEMDGIRYFVVGTAGGPCQDLDPGSPRPSGYQFGETRKLGYLKVIVDPARNVALAQQIAVGEVTGDDDDELPSVYLSPVVDDAVLFPLFRRQLGMKDPTVGPPPK
jgi:acid phosphatase type 7